MPPWAGRLISMSRRAKRKFNPALSSVPPPPSSKRIRTGTARLQDMAVSSSNGGAVGSSLVDEPIDYSALKAWIQQQETNPSPLTPLQQRAISDLRQSLAMGEPEIGNQDWISLLQRTDHVLPSPASTTRLTKNPQATSTPLPTATVPRLHLPTRPSPANGSAGAPSRSAPRPGP